MYVKKEKPSRPSSHSVNVSMQTDLSNKECPLESHISGLFNALGLLKCFKNMYSPVFASLPIASVQDFYNPTQSTLSTTRVNVLCLLISEGLAPAVILRPEFDVRPPEKRGRSCSISTKCSSTHTLSSD